MTAVLLSAVFNWLFLWFLIPQLRRRLLDVPNARSSHYQPTPRGGGISFVVVAAFSSGVAFFCGHHVAMSALPLLAVPLSIVGLLDDRLSLPVWRRYGVQLLTAILMLGFSPLVQRFIKVLVFGSPLSILFLALSAIVVSAVINFTNFMDGLDGLVAGSMSVAIASLVIALDAPWPLLALVGSLLGFLFWNWSPAKVFMGDVGSTFLGAVFAGLVIQAASWPQAFAYLLVATPLLGDACLCVPRRLLAGHRVFQAHRLHLFQRLHQAGWTHSRVSLTYILATAVLAVAMLVGGLPWVLGLATVELLVGVWLDQRVAVSFALASQG